MPDQELPVNSRDAPLRKPTPEEMKPSAIARRVLKEALLHPASIGPWTISASLLMWILINGPSLGLVGGMLATFFVGGVVFLINYLGRGQDRARAIADELLKLNRECEEQEQQQKDSADAAFAADIVGKCCRARSPALASKARDLSNSYDALLKVLKESSQKTGLERYRILAAKAYVEAGYILKDVLAIEEAMQLIDVGAVTAELEKKQGERRKHPGHTNKAVALDREIEALQRKIDVYNQQDVRLTELLAAVSDIDSRFQATRLKLLERSGTDPEANLHENGNSAEELDAAAETELRVERKLRGEMSEEERAIDNKYLQAGRNAEPDRQ